MDALRWEYEIPIWWPGQVKGHALLDIRNFGKTALARVAAALADGQEVSERHVHAPLEEGAPVVTLCGTVPADGGTRWYHLPVNGHFWRESEAEARQELRARVRRELGHDSAAVDVVGPLQP